ncbi:MAG: hypothetical protein AAF317_02310 [Pseudomonadota bacterium]
MIIGTINVTDRAVVTHRDSYILGHITVASARRPFLVPGLMFAAGLCGFAIAFADLLYDYEMIVIGVAALLCLIVGKTLGQLQLLSRDLRGSELSGAVYGSYRELNRIRREIADAVEVARRD